MLSITDSNQNGRNKLVTLTAARTGPFTGGVFVLWISDELSMFSVASLFSGNNNDTKNTDSGKLLVTMSKDAVLPHVRFGDTTSESVHPSILVCSGNVISNMAPATYYPAIPPLPLLPRQGRCHQHSALGGL